jgi:hypothetical protein
VTDSSLHAVEQQVHRLVWIDSQHRRRLRGGAAGCGRLLVEGDLHRASMDLDVVMI